MDEIAVIGCGAIGLPVAAALAARGARVAGVDVDPAKLARLAQGETELVDAGLAEALRAALTAGRLTFADRLARADGARTYVVATPTPASPVRATSSASAPPCRSGPPARRPRRSRCPAWGSPPARTVPSPGTPMASSSRFPT